MSYTFIIGCARSGTSILGELIASHPEVKYIFEASDVWELGGMGENESHRLTAQHATEEVKKQIRQWFETQSQSSRLVVEKNPRNSLRIPYVKEIFPEAKFIHIVRDGRDVACSMIPGCGGAEWNHLKPPSWQELYTKYSGAIRCAYAWKQVLEIALDDIRSVPYLQIRYEDLLTSPLSTAKVLFRFLGLSLHPNTVEFCDKITNNTASSYHASFQDRWYRKDHSTRISRWRENLNDEEKKIINDLLAPLLTNLGYVNNTASHRSSIFMPEKESGEEAGKSGKRIIAVLGMHRSGTSAITRGLQVLGVELGNKLLAPMEGINNKGFWEDMDINALNVEMLYSLGNDWHYLNPIQPSDVEKLIRNGYLQRAVQMLGEKTSDTHVFGFKDPRTAKLLPFWKEVFAQSQLTASYVVSTRHPLSVSQSLKERDGFDHEKSYLLWLEHVVSGLMHTQGEESVWVDFDRLLQSPVTELTRVANALHLNLDSYELETFRTEFLDENLRHTVYSPGDLELDTSAPPVVKEVYEDVLKIATDVARLDDPALMKRIELWNKDILRQKTALILADKLASQIYQAEVKNNQAMQVLRNTEQTLRATEHTLREKEQAYQEAATELLSLKNSRSWKLFILLISLFRKMVPPGTFRDRVFTRFWKTAHLSYRGLKGGMLKLSNFNITRRSKSGFVSIDPISTRTVLEIHKESTDIIVCVHNALADVQKCLETVVKYTSDPYSLIIVDDGSDAPTQAYLQEFAKNRKNCTVIRNEQAQGYTRAANQGLKQSNGDYMVLLNSDTLVGPEWIDRLCMAIRSDERNGIAGPLSNTASWQSIPKLSENGEWALNHLPENLTADEMSCFVAKYSARLYFQVPLLNGFCMMIRRQVINDIGYFDENSFGEGYGEEDDFNLRAQQRGWKLVIADDVYIYHAQSKSYTDDRRRALTQRAGQVLREKHGEGKIQSYVEEMNPNRILEGIRALSGVLIEREKYITEGRSTFAGKKVLFVLPVMEAGGGANVVIDEARAMQSIGVDVQIFNLPEYKNSFLSSYPHLDIPVVFGKVDHLTGLSSKFDATVATANYSVEWLKPLEGRKTLGYYIQGFEPLMYPSASSEAKRALASYSLIKGLKRFTKTEWVRQTVLDHTKMDSDVIGISVNIDLFRPRNARAIGKKPVTIVAMIRPESPYRSPELTVAVLRRIQKEYGRMVNILLFGTESVDEHSALFQLDFDWKLAGKLTQLQVANLLSNSDIFVDFSTHQAMGLTALEAMACGCAVIVPQEGGAIEYIRDKENGLVVPVISQEACYQQLKILVEDDYLRQRLQTAGLKTVSKFFPEKAAFNILKSLFS